MLPLITVNVNGVNIKALVDSGCEQSVVLERFCNQIGVAPCGPERRVLMLNGQITKCRGEAQLAVQVRNRHLSVKCLIAPMLVGGCSLILGMDAISKLGGVTITRNKQVMFPAVEPTTEVGKVSAVSVGVGVDRFDKTLTSNSTGELFVSDTDFNAKFDGKKWTVRWKWENGEPTLQNQCGQYAVKDKFKQSYHEQIQQWINDGWLQLYDNKLHGTVTGIVPLMAAAQPNKPTQVRPVMDYSRELNK